MSGAQVNRRSFLKFVGMLTGLQVDVGFDGSLPQMRDSIYEELAVSPFINAAGAFTDLGGALIPDEVMAAMKEVSQQPVSITELQQAVGKRIAAILGCDAALVTAGCASSLALATAACVAGKDPDKIRRLPDTTGMKNEVILQKAHRFEYDHAVRNVGVRLIEIELPEQLISAVNHRTAMLFFLNSADNRGKIRRGEFAQLAARVQLPALVDAAADLPPIENLWTLIRMGYDLVAFSGGKSLRGPQCSGLLLGNKYLVEAAFLNGPHTQTASDASRKLERKKSSASTRLCDCFWTPITQPNGMNGRAAWQ